MQSGSNEAAPILPLSSLPSHTPHISNQFDPHSSKMMNGSTYPLRNSNTNNISTVLESNLTLPEVSGDSVSIPVLGSVSSGSPTMTPHSHEVYDRKKQPNSINFDSLGFASNQVYAPDITETTSVVNTSAVNSATTFESNITPSPPPQPSYLLHHRQRITPQTNSTSNHMYAHLAVDSHGQNDAGQDLNNGVNRQEPKQNERYGIPETHSGDNNMAQSVSISNSGQVTDYKPESDRLPAIKTLLSTKRSRAKPAKRTFYFPEHTDQSDNEDGYGDDKMGTANMVDTDENNYNEVIEGSLVNESNQNYDRSQNLNDKLQEDQEHQNKDHNVIDLPNPFVNEHHTFSKLVTPRGVPTYLRAQNSNSTVPSFSNNSRSTSNKVLESQRETKLSGPNVSISKEQGLSSISTQKSPSSQPRTSQTIPDSVQEPTTQSLNNNSSAFEKTNLNIHNGEQNGQFTEQQLLQESEGKDLEIPPEIMEMTTAYLNQNLETKQLRHKQLTSNLLIDAKSSIKTSVPVPGGRTASKTNVHKPPSQTTFTNSTSSTNTNLTSIRSQEKSSQLSKRRLVSQADELITAITNQDTNPEYPEAQAEMANFYECFPSLRSTYLLVDKVGEGAFSTVYKAIDLCYDSFANNWDNGYSESVYARYRKADRRKKHQEALERYRLTGKKPTKPFKYVALKRIHVTAHPRRIALELSLLKNLTGSPNLLPLITGERFKDQVIAVIPYFEHDDFRDYYDEMSVSELRVYFKQLFNALAFIHDKNIIHRDVKAQNFLYNLKTHRGVLVDFGLAEQVSPNRKVRCECKTGGLSKQFPELDPNIYKTTNGSVASNSPSSASVSSQSSQNTRQNYRGSSANSAAASAAAMVHKCIAGGKLVLQGGKPRNDTRHSRRYSRAGTRGFRAPEVLFGCPDQTVSIDVWSAGIMLLSFLTKRCMFFQAKDDSRALIEMATIFGQRKMKESALLHGVVYETNIPSIPAHGYDISVLINWCLAAHYKTLNQKRSESERARKRRRREDPNANEAFKKSSTENGSDASRQFIDRDTRKAIDFLKICLEMDFRNRATALDALQHPFLKNVKIDIPIFGEENKEGYLDEEDEEEINSHEYIMEELHETVPQEVETGAEYEEYEYDAENQGTDVAESVEDEEDEQEEEENQPAKEFSRNNGGVQDPAQRRLIFDELCSESSV